MALAQPVGRLISAHASYPEIDEFTFDVPVRSRIEAKMRCLKAFGERIATRDPDRQTAEIQVRIA